MEGLGLEIMRLSWMEKRRRRRSKVAQEAAIVRRWGYKGIPNPSYEFITSNGFSKPQETDT
jgi:hypothetical protein